MKRALIIVAILAIIVFGGLMIFDKTVDPARANAPLTVRANNPGAVKGVNSKGGSIGWEGQIGVDERGHAKFSKVLFGARAMAMVVSKKLYLEGKNTLNAMLASYAGIEDTIGSIPGGKANDPKGYAARVGKDVGLSPAVPVPYSKFRAVLYSMTTVETGKPWRDYFNEREMDLGFKAGLVARGLDPKRFEGLA